MKPSDLGNQLGALHTKSNNIRKDLVGGAGELNIDKLVAYLAKLEDTVDELRRKVKELEDKNEVR